MEQKITMNHHQQQRLINQTFLLFLFRFKLETIFCSVCVYDRDLERFHFVLLFVVFLLKV